MTAQPTIIVVDDDPGMRESLEGLLRSVGLQVKALASVPEFMKEVRPEGPACLVLDVRLPGRSGLDFQRELSAADIHIPIVFITGYGDIPMSVQAIKGGAAEFLTKPFRDQDLLDAIQLGLARDTAWLDNEKAIAALRARFDGLEALGRHPHFTLAGIAGRDGARRRATYVHGKLMLVDDAFATIGSCNLHAYSLGGHSEMNASIWDAEMVRALRRTLLAEHLDMETAALDDRAALRLYQRIAGENRCRMQRDDHDWQGQAFALSPENYGRKPDEVAG